jgi:hypothetical protein
MHKRFKEQSYYFFVLCVCVCVCVCVLFLLITWCCLNWDVIIIEWKPLRVYVRQVYHWCLVAFCHTFQGRCTITGGIGFVNLIPLVCKYDIMLYSKSNTMSYYKHFVMLLQGVMKDARCWLWTVFPLFTSYIIHNIDVKESECDVWKKYTQISDICVTVDWNWTLYITLCIF